MTCSRVHQVLATRWANSLKGAKLDLVFAANDGYLPGMTNFAVRIASCALARASKDKAMAAQATVAPAFKKFKRTVPEHGSATVGAAVAVDAAPPEPTADPELSIPSLLEAYAARVPGLRAELGADFARGHARASGGIVRTAETLPRRQRGARAGRAWCRRTRFKVG
jgi:hypothetical protein